MGPREGPIRRFGWARERFCSARESSDASRRATLASQLITAIVRHRLRRRGEVRVAIADWLFTRVEASRQTCERLACACEPRSATQRASRAL